MVYRHYKTKREAERAANRARKSGFDVFAEPGQTQTRTFWYLRKKGEF
jgi:hypothetical protein